MELEYQFGRPKENTRSEVKKLSGDAFLKRASILLFFRGISFITSQRRLLWLTQIIFGAFFIGGCGYILYLTIFENTWTTTIDITTHVLFFVETFAMSYYFLKNKKRISFFVRKLVLSLNQEILKSIEKKTLCISVIGIFGILIRVFIFIGFGSLKLQLEARLIFAKVMEEALKNMCSNTVLVCSLTYLIFFQMLAQHSLLTIKRIQRYLLKSKFVDYEFVLNLLYVIKETMKTFDNIFNPIPFIAFFSSFYSATRTVILVSKSKTELKINFISEFLINNLCLTMILLYIDNKQGSVVEETDRLRKELLSKARPGKRPDSLLSSSIISVLDWISLFKMTAWSFFDLDKRLIFAFAAQVVQFNVLFLQLKQE